MSNDGKQTKWTHHDVKRGDAEAMKWLLQDAERGNAEAQWRLGMCYLKGHGHGIRRNRQEAVEWFAKAANLGYANAQYQLGMYYLAERSVLQSDAVAVVWLDKAAEQGNKEAAQILPSLLKEMERGATLRKTVQECRTKEIKKYRETAKGGDAEAQYQLGLIYSGTSKMLREAVFYGYREEIEPWFIAGIRSILCFARTLFRANVNAEDSGSHVFRYSRRYRVEPLCDYVEAAKWFFKAAEQGHTEAQDKIIEYYFNCTGTPNNPTETIEWFGVVD